MLDMMLGTAIAGAGQIGGQVLANNANKDIARENNAFNASEAQKNREYQTQMSNTAHQREVDDLRAAGLNPLLSANAGSSSPGGSTASSSGNPQMQNPFANLNIGGTLRDIAQLELQSQSTQADVRVKDAQAAKTISDTSMDPTRKKLMLQQIEESKWRSHPNTVDSFMTRYLDKFIGSMKTNADKQKEDWYNKLSPSDINKIQNGGFVQP